MSDAATKLLTNWLHRQVPQVAAAWLGEQLGKLKDDPSDRNLHIALGMVPRKLGRDDLALKADDLAAAGKAREGWDPSRWSVDVAARVLLLCRVSGRSKDFAALFSQLCRYADPAEAVACYSGLPLYPQPERLEEQAAEGVRTNMRAVFEAIAHRNPYPCEKFDENRWNHMVLKALFIGSTLSPIQGLDERANPELARILRDYAHERWAAGRPVAPDLWRCVGPFAGDDALEDLVRVAGSEDVTEQKAAALALSVSPASGAAELLETLSEHAAAIEKGQLTRGNGQLKIEN
jgi:hypothetical protein